MSGGRNQKRGGKHKHNKNKQHVVVTPQLTQEPVEPPKEGDINELHESVVQQLLVEPLKEANIDVSDELVASVEPLKDTLDVFTQQPPAEPQKDTIEANINELSNQQTIVDINDDELNEQPQTSQTKNDADDVLLDLQYLELDDHDHDTFRAQQEEVLAVQQMLFDADERTVLEYTTPTEPLNMHQATPPPTISTSEEETCLIAEDKTPDDVLPPSLLVTALSQDVVVYSFPKQTEVEKDTQEEPTNQHLVCLQFLRDTQKKLLRK